MVKDIVPGPSSSDPEGLTDVDGVLYFSANDGPNGVELRMSDGTTAGTVMVKDIWPGSDSSYPSGITGANGRLYFSADDHLHGDELWIYRYDAFPWPMFMPALTGTATP